MSTACHQPTCEELYPSPRANLLTMDRLIVVQNSGSGSDASCVAPSVPEQLVSTITGHESTVHYIDLKSHPVVVVAEGLHVESL